MHFWISLNFSLNSEHFFMERQIGSRQFILGQTICKKDTPNVKKWAFNQTTNSLDFTKNIKITFKLNFLHSYCIIVEILGNLCQIGLLSVRPRVKVRHFFSWCKADNQNFEVWKRVDLSWKKDSIVSDLQTPLIVAFYTHCLEAFDECSSTSS